MCLLYKLPEGSLIARLCESNELQFRLTVIGNHVPALQANHLGIDLVDFCRRVTANTEAAYATRWGGDD